jgi:DNA-binding NarL/FixJ family response regulator
MPLVKDPINVLAVGTGVEGLDVRVEVADDLLGALARLADGGIDVVVVSLELPDGRGADVVRAVLERAPAVPVVAVADAAEAEEALEAGAADVVPAAAGAELLTRAIGCAFAVSEMRAEIGRLERMLADGASDAPGNQGQR